MASIGERIKQGRITRSFTQKELAQAVNTSQQQIAKWEAGLNDPNADMLGRLANALGCAVDWLLGLVEQPTDHVKLTDLSADEWKLIELYRRGELAELVIRLVTKLDKDLRWKAFLGADQDEAASQHSGSI